MIRVQNRMVKRKTDKLSGFNMVMLKRTVGSSDQLLFTQDGYLDASEVAHWVLPGEVDHADNEAKHLIHETDTDKVHCHSSELLSNF